MKLTAIPTLFALVAQAVATVVNFRGSGFLSRQLAESVLEEEIADRDHHVGKFEDALRQIFTSLPKNSHGNLAHQTVRYALHRFFVDRHGWFIGGLEPIAALNSTVLPNILQNEFEKRAGEKGVDLHGLATLAASLDDLAEQELRARMRDMYSANDAPSNSSIARQQANEVLHTFLISFLVANNWKVVSKKDLENKKHIFGQQYRDFNGTMAWYEAIRDKHLTDGQNSFQSVSQVASEVSKAYHSYNDLSCRAMRSVLRDAESRRPGRVRLSTFYNISLHGHWDFTEKVEFLRALGVLDETDPKQISVIVPNYAVSRLNCLNATNLYQICCRNVCDDLTSSLERQIGAPTATAERIAELVSKMSSESVAASRELPATLLGRLRDVAAFHKGQVPLHGRLFAQWMHHAYPLECPFPQEAGTVSVQTPEEWLAQTGQATQAASPEEMRGHVDADTCAVNWEGKVECGEESTEIPWSMTEDVLHPTDQEAQTSSGAYLVLSGLCLVVAMLLARPLLSKELGPSQRRDAIMAVALSLMAAAYFAELLDGLVFLVAVLGSFANAGAKFAGKRFAGDSSSLPFRQAKKV